MTISFNPPLAQLTTLQLSFPASDQVFSAKFSNIKEHARAKAAGARLELWSDIGNDEGHWRVPGALPFEWLNDSLVLKISSESFIRPLKNRFGFTYRLVYPNGDVHWLGTHDRNGELLVRVEDDRFQVPFSKGWRADGSSLVYQSSGNDSRATKLTEKANWAIWTFENESAPKLSKLGDDLSNVRCALLIPHQIRDDVGPLAPILLSSTGTFAIARSGSVVTSASLTLKSPTVVDLESCIPNLRFIYKDHAVVLGSTTSLTKKPAHLSIIPLVPTQNMEFSVPLSKLNLPSETSELALYSPASSIAHFVSASAENCPVAVGPFGSQWLVAPVYQLNDTDVKITLLTPHSKIENAPHRLPTPPPSPILPMEPQMQPLRMEEPVEEELALEEPVVEETAPLEEIQTEENLVVGPAPAPVQVSQGFSFIRRIFNFYTGLFWWIFNLISRRISSFNPKPKAQLEAPPVTKSAGSSVVGSGASTPVGVRSLSTASTPGTATPTTPVSEKDHTVFDSPTVEKDLEEKTRGWAVEMVESGLTFDLQGPVKLILNKASEVKAFKFGIDGKDIEPGSVIALRGGGQVLDFTEVGASGRFTIIF